MNKNTETVTGEGNAPRVAFTNNDVTELFHIIRSRGHSETRVKLLNALRSLDRELAERIDKQDEEAS